jgi:hypothetical protein
MTLASLITQHAAAAATAGDWASVAAAIQALELREDPRLCSGVETAMALAGVGASWPAVIELIEGDATGRWLLTKLAGEGVKWAHSLTTPYLQAKQSGALSVAAVQALIGLSAPLLYADLTAEQCQAAVQAAQAQQAFQALQDRRLAWDTLSAQIRSQIESGQLADNAAVVAAVTAGLGV